MSYHTSHSTSTPPDGDWRKKGEILCDRSCLPSQLAWETYNQEREKKLCAPREFLQKCSAMFDNHTILLFWLKNKQTFHMFSLGNLFFVLCSFDLDVQRAQRIIGLFLKTHKKPFSAPVSPGRPLGVELLRSFARNDLYYKFHQLIQAGDPSKPTSFIFLRKSIQL